MSRTLAINARFLRVRANLKDNQQMVVLLEFSKHRAGLEQAKIGADNAKSELTALNPPAR